VAGARKRPNLPFSVLQYRWRSSRHSSGWFIMHDLQHDAVLMQFNRLIEELIRGSLNRSSFQPWEVEILVDMVRCTLPGASRRVTMLREYQNAVQQRIREGAQVPPKLSEYLQLKGKSSNLARRAQA
jgi:hypothetical protein